MQSLQREMEHLTSMSIAIEAIILGVGLALVAWIVYSIQNMKQASCNCCADGISNRVYSGSNCPCECHYE